MSACTKPMNLYIVKHKWYKLDHQYDPMENYFATGRSVVMVAALIQRRDVNKEPTYLVWPKLQLLHHFLFLATQVKTDLGSPWQFASQLTTQRHRENYLPLDGILSGIKPDYSHENMEIPFRWIYFSTDSFSVEMYQNQ